MASLLLFSRRCWCFRAVVGVSASLLVFWRVCSLLLRSVSGVTFFCFGKLVLGFWVGNIFRDFSRIANLDYLRWGSFVYGVSLVFLVEFLDRSWPKKILGFFGLFDPPGRMLVYQESVFFRPI